MQYPLKKGKKCLIGFLPMAAFYHRWSNMIVMIYQQLYTLQCWLLSRWNGTVQKSKSYILLRRKTPRPKTDCWNLRWCACGKIYGGHQPGSQPRSPARSPDWIESEIPRKKESTTSPCYFGYVKNDEIHVEP